MTRASRTTPESRASSSRGTPVARGRGTGARWVPFGAHQAVEYLVAALLVETALHLNGRPQLTLLCAAGTTFAVAFLSEGSLGLLHLLPPRLHRLLDAVVIAALALSPIAYWRNLSLAPVLATEASAILLARVATLTRYGPQQERHRVEPSRAERQGAKRNGVEGQGAGRHGTERELASPEAGSVPSRPAAPTGRPGARPETHPGSLSEVSAPRSGAPKAGPPPPARRGSVSSSTRRRPPSTAWTLGVLAARARKRYPRPLDGGARRLGQAVGRASGKDGDGAGKGPERGG